MVDYRDILHGLLPQGMIWPDSSDDSILGGVLDVLGDQMLKLVNEAESTVSDMFPDSNGVFISDWERVLNLPLAGTGTQTSAERVGTILAWLNISQYSDRQFFVDIALLIGFVITVDDKTTDGALNPEEIRINGVTTTPVPARVGANRAGDALINYLGIDSLKELILFFRPAGSKVIWN